MKKRLLSLLLFSIFALAGYSAINYSLNESFESGIPATWSQEVVNTNVGGAWILDTVATNPNGAYDGTGRVVLRSPEGNMGYQVRLITPALDLSAVNNPRLSFAYAQPRKASKFSDTLSVYFRVSETDSWVLLRKYSDYQQAWSLQQLELPAACRVDGCQFAFEGKENGGYGVLLDLVRVFPESQCANVEITGIVVSASQARVNWQSQPGRQFELIVSASAISDLSSYDTSTAVFYANNITGAGQTVSGLTASTKYYVYARTDCDDNESGHTEWVSANFTTAIGLPYAPNMAAIPSAFSQKVGAAESQVNVDDLSDNSSSYTWASTSTTTVLGSAHWYAQNTASAPSWLLTPQIDLSGVDDSKSILLSFKLAITNSISSTSSTSYASSSKFHIYVSEDEGESWTRIRTIAGDELTNTGRTFNILLDEYKDAGSIRLAFVSEASYSYSVYFHFGDLNIIESDGQCLGLSGLSASPSASSISLSWSVIGSTNSAIAVISTHSNFSDSLEVKNISATSVSFDGLTSGTTYYVSVRQDCEGSEALTAAVTTAFAAPYANPFTSSTMPSTWTQHSGKAPADVYSSGLGASSTGLWTLTNTMPSGMSGYAAKFNVYSNKKYWLASPAIYLDTENTYRLSFLVAITKYNNRTTAPAWASTDSEFAVLISEDGGSTWNQSNATTWRLDGTGDNDLNTIGITPYNVLINLAAYQGKTIKVAIYQSCSTTSTDNDIYVSNFEIQSYDASCGGVEQLKATSTSDEIAATWSAVGSNDVIAVLSKSSTFADTLQSQNLTEGNYTFSGLDANTQYYISIRQLCLEDASTLAVKTQCGDASLPYVEGFEDYAANAAPDCWNIIREGGSYPYVIANSSYSTYSHEGTKAFAWGTSYSTTAYKSFAVLPKMSSAINLLEMDFYVKIASSYYDDPDSLLVGVMDAPDDTASFVQVAGFIPSSTSYELKHVDFSSYSGSGEYIAFVRVLRGEVYYSSTYYTPSIIDDIKVSLIPTCDRMGAVELISATPNSATLRFAATNASQYQVVITTSAINPDTLAQVDAAKIAYNDLVSSTQPVIPSLEGNTHYFAYVRGFCGGEDYSEWANVLAFKTLCNPMSAADMGLMTFDDPASVDCWTFGFTTPGTSSYNAYAKRDSVKAYGAYIKLSKESVAYTKNAAGVDTLYSDGAYAIAPELDEADIRNFQVSFSAATTSTLATNYKRLNIGILVDPNDFSGIEILKTIDLDYAADSTALKSYTVSFANYEGDYLGQFGKYVIFQLNEPAKHDSTNFVLIDNVQFEAASTCEQLMETSLDSVGILGARISWENAGAAAYQVMVANVNSLRPDTITSPISLNIVSENKATLSDLLSNTTYSAYVRAICGEGDTAKWSNAISFRTSIAVPYQEPFSATTLSEGWRSKYYYAYASSLPDSIVATSFTDNSSYPTWTTTSISLPSGMSGYAALVETESSSYSSTYAWLISPVIDMTDNADDFIELSFKMAGTNLYSTGYVALYVSVDGSAYKKEATWLSSNGTFDYSEISATAQTYVLNFTKYAGKTISFAIGTYQYMTYSASAAPRLLIDDVDVHTTSANCRGIATMDINPAAESAKVTWEIEGTPVKAEVEISAESTFAELIDSVGVEDALEHSFSGLTPNTTYYVRVRQLECENAEWVDKSFKTSCSPISAEELPWIEGFESKATGSSSADAPECWNLLNANDGAYPYIYVNTSSSYVLNGSKSLYFQSSSSRYGYAILPAFETPLNEMVIDFSYKDENTSSSGYLDLGYMTNVADEKSFVSIASFSRSTSWVTVTGQLLDSIPDAVASSARLAFRYGGASNNYYLGIDDITVRLIPGCPDMAGLAVDSIVSDSARLVVNNLGAAGYHFVVASAEIDLSDLSEADAAKIILNDSVYGDTAVFVDGLASATNYYVYARTLCDDDKVGAWSNPVAFKSACGVISISEDSPWKENFESYATGSATNGFSDPCWSNVHTVVVNGYTTYTNYRYYISSTTNGTNATKQLCLPDMSSGNITLLATPEIAISDADACEFQLDVYRSASGTSYPTEGVRIYASLSDTIDATAQELAFISRNKDQADGTRIPAESATGWYTYKLSIPLAGNVRILIQGESKYGSSTYLDNFIVRLKPSCLPISNLAAKLTQGDGTIASLSWESDDVAAWKVQYATSEDFSNAVDTTISDTSYIELSGLTPETIYYARVKNVCIGGAESEWSDAISFKPTNALALTINEGNTTNGYVPVYGFYVDNLTSSQFVIPADSLVALQWDSIKQLVFYSSNTSIDWGTARFEVYMAEVTSTTISALADWSTLTKVMNAGSLSISGNQMVVTLDVPYQYTGGNLLIGFKQTVTGSYATCNWYGKSATGASFGGYSSSVSQRDFLPKLTLEYIPGVEPACVKPSNLTAKLTQGDGTIASLSWESDEVAAWKVQYATLADFSNAVDSTISDTSYIELSGLTPETTYYARVKNVCDGGAESDWCDAISFVPTNKLALTINDGTTTNGYVPIYGFYVDNLTSSQFVIPADSLVAMQWDSIKQLVFYASNASVKWGTAKFEVYMAEVSSTTISALADWSTLTKVMNAGSLSISGNQMVVTLDIPYQYTDGNLLIGFKQTVSGSYSSCNWYGKSATGASFGGYGSSVSQQGFLPKLTLEYIPGVEPACKKISNLMPAKVGATSAELNFKASEAPEYEYVLTLAEIGPDTLSLVADSLIALRDTVDTNFVAINSLQPATEYYVYVRGLCSESELSEWTNAQFSTLCLAAVPYVENFDDATDRKPVYAGTSSYTIPSCWSEGYTSTSYVSRIDDNTTYASYAYSGTSALRLYSYYYSSLNTSYVVLPELDAALDTLQLTFKARAMSDGSSVSNYATSSYAHSVKIGTLTDPNDLSTFQLLNTYVLAEVSSTPSSADNYWEDVTIYLLGATGKFIALVSDFDKSNYVWIDDVEVSRAPDCLAPSLVTVNPSARVADIVWSSSASEFEVALGQAGFVLPTGADSIYSIKDTTGLHLADLEPSTDYELYVRTVCGENVTSEWSSAVAFSTLCLLPDFAEYNFDDANTRFLHHKDSIHEEDYYGYVDRDDVSEVYMENCWIVNGYDEEVNTSYYDYDEYSTIYQTGKRGHYPSIVENEESYIYARSGSGALVFNSSNAKAPLVAAMAAMETLDRDSLQLEFWARPGYASGTSMSGATTTNARMLRVGVMTNPNDLSTFEELSTIRGDVLSGNPSADVEGENYWRRYVVNLGGTTAPFIAFVYDSTAANLFFVDDVRIKKMATCGEPAAPQISDITANTAVVRWEAFAPAYQVALIHGADTVKQMVASFDTLKLENLVGASTYVVKLRAFCNENDSSEWSAPVSFLTDCEPIAALPWNEDFENLPVGSESSDAPLCWDMLNTNQGQYPYVYVSTAQPHDGEHGLYFKTQSGYSSAYAILPEFAVPANAMKVTFWYKHENTTNSGDLDFGYMTDINSEATFVSLLSCPKTTTWTSISVNTNSIPDALANSVRFVFRNTASASSIWYYAAVDDIQIEELDLTCLGVENLAVTNISTNGAKINFRFIDGLDHDAQVAISKEAAFDEATAIQVQTISDSSYMFNVALEDRTTYYIYVRQACDDSKFSAWEQISFETPYIIRYGAEFESTTMPAEWLRYSGKVDDVLAGTTQLATATSGWYLTSADTVLNTIHFRGNICSTSFNYWMVSPLVLLAAPDGSNVQLHFDAGLVPYSSSYRSSRNTGADDRFAVLISTDNGTSWTKLSEWNNSGSPLVYNDIPEHAKTFFVDLSSYVGQSVRVAFYGESTVSNADNYLHFGNIVINHIVEQSYTGIVCEGNDYIGADFGNSFNITPDQYQVGENTYEKYAPAANGSGAPDSTLTLTLTVEQINNYEESVVLCEGEHYSETLHGKLFEFDAYVGMPDQVKYIVKAGGCEDVVELHVTVNQKIEVHIGDSIERGQTYKWHGQTYISATVAQFDTVSLVTGCDSITYLHLSVYEKTALDDVAVHKLHLNPNPVEVGQPINVLNDFSGADLADMQIEVFSAAGVLIYAQHGATDPVIIPGLGVSGLHIVRISIGKDVFISPLLVK